MKKRVVVIGAGFAGLSAACFLAKEGYEVEVFEKNEQAGGRARLFEAEGFRFDMGPSWYWMPDVFEKFFASFGKKVSDYYTLTRLSPSYRIVFNRDKHWDIPASVDELAQEFEQREKGAGKALYKFLDEAKYKYEIGINQLVHKPSLAWGEFMNVELMKGAFRLDVFHSMAKHIRSRFRHTEIVKLLEFPVLFLGGTAQTIPALYSLMNYADIVLGTWYPQKGMHEIVKAMVSLAEELGVKIHLNSPVEKILTQNDVVTGVVSNGKNYAADAIVGGADYHHIEQEILAPEFRQYTPKYWDERTLAPSSLLFYLGINKKINNLRHHTLCFDEEFDLHAKEIYDTPKWPTKPLFYLSCPSKTDETVAPPNCENLLILMPAAPNLNDTEETRERYFNLIIKRLEKLIGEDIASHIIFKRSYAHKDFIQDYHSFKGNAYGLANTLMQTAILKPSLKSKKLKNMYFAGQLTVPGPGVPPSLISGQVVAAQIAKEI